MNWKTLFWMSAMVPMMAFGQVYMTVDDNYRGGSLELGAGFDSNGNAACQDLHEKKMGDKISSVMVDQGYTAVFYIDRNCSGTETKITGSACIPCLHTERWGKLGDNASSVRVYENRDPIRSASCSPVDDPCGRNVPHDRGPSNPKDASDNSKP